MKPKDDYETRCRMAEMHEKVLSSINSAYEKKNNIEVCWLCYACFESRINRVIEKVCDGCNKPERKDNRHIGISTKIKCLKRLAKNKYISFSKDDEKILADIGGWCKQRNKLMHGLVSLDVFNDADKQFRQLAANGRSLVPKAYELGSSVREFYYMSDIIPEYPIAVIDECKLAYKCVERRNISEL